MTDNGNTLHQRAATAARTFGSLIRSRRRALAMSQDQLALATGVGRRFLIELEAGKISCQLGRSLVVADALGLRPSDVPKLGKALPLSGVPDLPDLPDEEEEEEGRNA